MRQAARLCAALPFLVAACAPKGETAVKDSAATAPVPVVDAAAVRQAIEQANTRFEQAVQSGDSAAIVANYADDAMMMMGGAAAWRGRSEIAANAPKAFQSATVKLTTGSVDVGGDYAIETGTYDLTATPPGGKPVTDKGKYITVWKKQPDGSWKIYRDIANTDIPPKS
jgi:uncharacterized protein (TIGR02246 family)